MSDDFYQRQISRDLIGDAVVYGLGASRASRDFAQRVFPQHFYKTEKDPMQVSINLREISNGVLVTVHSAWPFIERGHETPEYHYPDPASAFAAAPALLQQAWAEASEPRSRSMLHDAFKRAQGGSVSAESDPSQQTQNAGFDPVMPEIGAKLPEEAATEAMPTLRDQADDFMHEQPPVRISDKWNDTPKALDGTVLRDLGDETAASD